jgi:type VI secretion system protein ImpE
MPTAKEMFDAGNLKGAIEEVTREVKSSPTDMRKRIFLFELLCFTGEFDRAERQLDVIGQQSVNAEIGVLVYRNNLKAERDRRSLFSDGAQPHYLNEPPAYVDLCHEAINCLREGNVEKARQLLDQAEEDRPTLSGKVNGQPFLDFRDYNDLVGPVLEVIVQDHYTWLPFEQIRRIEITAPKQLRDLMWAPARIEAADGTIGEVYIPALYSGSSEHADDLVKLGRMTDWKNISENLFSGYGLRLFLVDGEDIAMFEARNIEFDLIEQGGQSAPS